MLDSRTEFGIGSRDLNGAIARPAKAGIREIREGEGNRGEEGGDLQSLLPSFGIWSEIQAKYKAKVQGDLALICNFRALDLIIKIAP